MIEYCDKIVHVLKLCEEKNETWDLNKRGLHLSVLQRSFCLAIQQIAYAYNASLENQSPKNEGIMDVDIKIKIDETNIIQNSSLILVQEANETDQEYYNTSFISQFIHYNIFDLIPNEILYPYNVECQLEDPQLVFPILMSVPPKIHKTSSLERVLKSSLYRIDNIMPYEMDDALLTNIWKY